MLIELFRYLRALGAKKNDLDHRISTESEIRACVRREEKGKKENKRAKNYKKPLQMLTSRFCLEFSSTGSSTSGGDTGSMTAPFMPSSSSEV